MNEHGSGLGAGVRIGEYEIVRELGFGGFGVTYLARDRVLERLVAVKEYFPMDWGTRRTDGTVGPRTTASSKDYAWGLERFVDEARALARLDHPGRREGVPGGRGGGHGVHGDGVRGGPQPGGGTSGRRARCRRRGSGACCRGWRRGWRRCTRLGWCTGTSSRRT